MFVFGALAVDTDAESYDVRHPHQTISQHERRKRGNISILALRDDATSCRLCYQWMGWLGRIQRRDLSNWMMPCQTNGTGNTLKHAGMSSPVCPLTWCWPSDFWFRVHRVASPINQDLPVQLTHLHLRPSVPILLKSTISAP